ncbi:four helix bundle protein [Moorena sp. SIO4G3]|uniref:four helix bundle protein n=1 Tax=Moorena sp. SIO4G3 TaxID=2607821 RepID=UPI0025CE1E00|nr:four helix bundle protein [Moorena sp. SIO4G3]
MGSVGSVGRVGSVGGVGSYWSSDRGVWEDGEDRREERWQLKKIGNMGAGKEKGKKYFRTHEDLVIYQLAFETAMLIFEHSKKFPVEEKYSLS